MERSPARRKVPDVTEHLPTSELALLGTGAGFEELSKVWIGRLVSPSTDRHVVLGTPAGLSRPLLGPLKQVENTRGLRFGVGPAVIAPALGVLPLGCSVPLTRVGMRSKVVAVQEVVTLPHAALGTHVDVDVAWAGRRGTEVTALIVPAAELDPDPLNRGDVCALVGQVPHADLYVDYRLGVEPRHGGRADVLNPPRNRTEHGRELGAVILEAGPPLRIRGDDLDHLVGGVAARDRRVPWDEDSHRLLRERTPFLARQLVRCKAARAGNHRVQVDERHAPVARTLRVPPRDDVVAHGTIMSALAA